MMNWFDRVLIGLALMGTGFLIGVVVTWQPLPYEQMYNEFNNIKMYEDGSYVGETREGIVVRGCIPQAICND